MGSDKLQECYAKQKPSELISGGRNAVPTALLFVSSYFSYQYVVPTLLRHSGYAEASGTFSRRNLLIVNTALQSR